MKSQRQKTRLAISGFTLIELLVVIAIIAILAAILFPVFATARDKARQTACLSNEKQIGMAILQYAQDFDELLPVAGPIAQNRGRWTQQIYPYIRSAAVFTCPNINNNQWSATNNTQGGYGWNWALEDGCELTGPCTALQTDNAPGFPITKVAQPSATIIVGEVGFDVPTANNYSASYAIFPADSRTVTTSCTSPNYIAQFRHSSAVAIPEIGGTLLSVDGFCSFLFLDGHTKALNAGQAFATAASENGTTLDATASTCTSGTLYDDYTSRFVLWNIY
ncbi:MAG: DUF1559 domain-containing protein [Capsulimonadaceae bacterium]|nr:DUF1559 domain-containing protein [Capsulimonadaceae bacterium]